MTNGTTTLRTWQKRAKRRLFYSEERARFTLRDWAIMLAVTLCYAAVAFTNLGAHDIADTYYQLETGDEIGVTFAQAEDIAYIKYFTSLGTGKLSFMYSPDGENDKKLEWDTEVKDESGKSVPTVTTQHDHVATDMYEWQFIEVEFSARHVTIHADKGGLRMTEMAFCDSEGKPVKIASVEDLSFGADNGSGVANMFDEQQDVPQKTSYYTEMYFDEVYHARTGYEYINHLGIYEWTHPPLGKNFLSLGIYIFGMNPFGWRCMGTLFGVLMLPVMYVFGKRLFKKTLFAFIPTFLMAVDFMHYSQTRIATIDSYSVFFIMLMCLFMYMYTETNYNREPLVNTLLPLSLCGIAFGLGAATKWICLYAGAGLAVLLFVQLGKRYLEYAYARHALAGGPSSLVLSEQRRTYLEDIARGYLRRTLITLLWCVLFFIIVPMVIYVMSYLPFMAPATDSAGFTLRYAYFAFTALLIFGIFALWMIKLRNDREAEEKAVFEAAADAQAAPTDMDAAPQSTDGAQAPQSAEPAEAETRMKRAERRVKPNGKYARQRVIAIVLCVLTLAAAGAFLYYNAFVLYTDADQGSFGHPEAFDMAKMLDYQEQIYNYHKGCTTPHPYSAKWHQWPLDVGPMCFFMGTGYSAGTKPVMFTMGNPAVWWGGLAAVITLIVIRIRKGRFGRRTFFLSVAALSQYLPWVLVPRTVYIYHYFATTPFMILLMAVLAKYLIERTRRGKKFVYIYLGVALLFFVLYYPVTTGTEVSATYSNTLMQLPWFLYNLGRLY